MSEPEVSGEPDPLAPNPLPGKFQVCSEQQDQHQSRAERPSVSTGNGELQVPG